MVKLMLHAVILALAITIFAYRTRTSFPERMNNIEREISTVHPLRRKFSSCFGQGIQSNSVSGRICLPGADILRLKGGGKARLYHRSFAPEGPWSEIGGKVNIFLFPTFPTNQFIDFSSNL